VRAGAEVARHFNPENAVAVLGGAILQPDSQGYREAVRLGFLLSMAGFVVATGAGPGAMDAASAGAMVAHRLDRDLHPAPAGFALASLSSEQKTSANIPEHLLARMWDLNERQRKLLHSTGQAIAVPGGTGTLNEITQLIVEQTRRLTIAQPILLLQPQHTKPFWDPLQDVLERMEQRGVIRWGERFAARNVSTVQESVDYLWHYRQHIDAKHQPYFDERRRAFVVPLRYRMTADEFSAFNEILDENADELPHNTPAASFLFPVVEQRHDSVWEIVVECNTGHGQIAHNILGAFIDSKRITGIDHVVDLIAPTMSTTAIDRLCIKAGVLPAETEIEVPLG
jgi:predicted Rossmann-fold nucleotide-binding protein